MMESDYLDYTKVCLFFTLFTKTATPEERTMFLFHLMADEQSIHDDPNSMVISNTRNVKIVLKTLVTLATTFVVEEAL